MDCLDFIKGHFLVLFTNWQLMKYANEPTNSHAEIEVAGTIHII
jgi:hypothetical protein